MKHLMRPLSLSATFAIVTMATNIFSTPCVWAQASLPVRVTNTPLPVQGSVNAVITNPSVPVSGTVNVSSLPAVQLSGTPAVTVENADTSPVPIRDVDHPANEPFSASLCTFNSVISGTSCESFYQDRVTVPTTSSGKTVKRLVIEFVSGICDIPHPDTYLFNLSLLIGLGEAIPPSRNHYLVPVSVPNLSGGPKQYASTQQTRIYANPGQSVTIDWGVRGGDLRAVCHFTLEGSLITQ